MTCEVPISFDSVAKIEDEPTDEAIGKRLLDSVSIEAFTNGRDEPGNYIIEVRTIRPENRAERERVAFELGINSSDEAIPHLPAQFSNGLTSRIGFELRNCQLLRPRL